MNNRLHRKNRLEHGRDYSEVVVKAGGVISAW